jgi:DNA modification methylase
MRNLTCQIKGYIQPFERQLALEELKALTSAIPIPIDADAGTALRFCVSTDVALESLQTQLAYWQTVGVDTQHITAQLRGEATSIIARNGVALNDLPRIVPQIIDSKLPNKRCLRYATHGMHEYRGKFFPQLVRALMNIAQVPASGVILDPMCGSGTTLVETVLAGRTAYGSDMNPLSVFVAGVKCRALGIEPKLLIDAFDQLSRSLKKPVCKLTRNSYFATFTDCDRDYLERWFAPSVLEELDHIEGAIKQLHTRPLRDFFSLSLSNILRGVSWQKDDDLRVRRQVITPQRGEVIARFIDEATRSTKTLVAFVTQRGQKNLGVHVVHEADARNASQLGELKGRVHAIITSPPYATALPYLDTDRLSLIYLGLLPRQQHRPRDAIMIGNREVTERTREAYWEAFQKHCDLLPKDTRVLVERIDHLNKSKDVGFRRRNLSALLAKYFLDMRSVISEQRKLLRPGGVMFMVVGNNRTTAGGMKVEIRTTHHLTQIAESVGFRVAGNLAMEMLTSRDIFRNNAMPSEQILTFQRDQ